MAASTPTLMVMPMPDPTNTTTAISKSSTALPTGATDPMAQMNMAEGGSSCKIRMLWNWYTIDACFLSESWHIRSQGGFAAFCIGTILLVMFLEFLRRVSKIYDRHLIRCHSKNVQLAARPRPAEEQAQGSSDTAEGSLIAKSHHALDPNAPFRPNICQQGIRALIHAAQFAVAYWIMLLAMYYNGFIIICILIGSFLGSFVFQWERLGTGHTC